MKATKDKYTLINKLLYDEYIVVQINASQPGVVLPEHLQKDPSVGLKLSKLFTGGMDINEERIEANLSFNKKYFCCIIPLDAIWSVTSVKNETTVWPDSAPIEHLNKLLNKSQEPEKAEKVPVKKPVLKRVK